MEKIPGYFILLGEKKDEETDMRGQEELLALRALVERQKAELEEKNRIIEEKDRIIAKKDIQIENMVQALLQAGKKMFGRSTEISGSIDGQMSLFGTAQELVG